MTTTAPGPLRLRRYYPGAEELLGKIVGRTVMATAIRMTVRALGPRPGARDLIALRVWAHIPEARAN